MIGTRPAFQLSVLCLSFTRNAPSNYEFAYAPLVRALTSSTGVLVGIYMPTRLATLRNGTAEKILRVFETAQVLQLTGCVEGSSLRRSPAHGRREELAGGIVHDSQEPQRRHSYRRGSRYVPKMIRGDLNPFLSTGG